MTYLRTVVIYIMVREKIPIPNSSKQFINTSNALHMIESFIKNTVNIFRLHCVV